MGKSCKAAEKNAYKARDRSDGIWGEYYRATEEYTEAFKKSGLCWGELEVDIAVLKDKGASMDTKEFRKRTQECSNLDEQEHQLEKRYLNEKKRNDEAFDSWKKAEDKWQDCIHEQTKSKKK